MPEQSPAPDFHVPVLVREVIAHLHVRPQCHYMDCTAGDGGHTRAILEAGDPDARLIACDIDTEALQTARARLAPYGRRVSFVRESYVRIDDILVEARRTTTDGVLLDLGASTRQLTSAHRGFSFYRDGPLDMRFDTEEGPTAADILRRRGEKEIADLIFHLGEERYARRIARAIVRERRNKPIKKTSDLADIILSAVPGRRGRTHPATRAFQALRIEVNGELENIRAVLEKLPAVCAPGGRAVVISFHSLEDRLVKTAFRQGAREGLWHILTPKPLRPAPEEVSANPASRSARLRAVERI